MSRPKILIDADPGHDDAVAILYAARHLDLLAITTVHGNNTLDNTTRNALAVVELAGLDVPVARGCAEPLAQPRNAVAAVHGATGLDGAELPVPRRQPVAAHAVDVIIETAARHKGVLVLAAIGPLTNVALALRREPRLAGWLRELTIMGGSTDHGNITSAAEFNIHCDPEAAWVVLESGAALRMVGLNVTRHTGFDRADLAQLRGSGRKVAGVVADLLSFYLDRQAERRGATIAPMHDVCAIVPLVEADLIEHRKVRVDVELAGRHTRGMTVCDLRGLTEAAGRPAANALVAVEARSRALAEAVLATLLTYP